MTILSVKPKHFEKATRMVRDPASRDTADKVAWLRYESAHGKAAITALEGSVLPTLFASCKHTGLTGPLAAAMIEDFFESYIDQLYRVEKSASARRKLAATELMNEGVVRWSEAGGLEPGVVVSARGGALAREDQEGL